MDAASIQSLLREGIAAAKLAQQKSISDPMDRRAHARELLLYVTELDEQNIPAWLWLSVVVDTPEEKETCLENVLALDPTNELALAGLARLKQTAPGSVPPIERDEAPSSVPPLGGDEREGHPPAGSKYPRLKPRAAAQARPSPAENAARVRRAQPGPTKRAAPACPFCRRPISAIDKTCPYCRLPLVMDCPRCGTAVDVEQNLCSECRYPMGDYRQPLDYFAQLGQAYQKSQHYEEAVTAWQAVETLQPDYPHLQLRLSEAHLGMGRPDRAWSSLQQALKQDPNMAEVHFVMGEFTRQRGEGEAAFKHYQTTVQLDPQHGPAWFQLGQLYQKARMSKEAMQAYRRVVKLLPPAAPQRRQAEAQLERLAPSLPESLATGWPELTRQMTGPVFLCLLAVLLDSGLRPWWIPVTGWLALLLAGSGTFLCVSGAGLPRNPLIRLLAGERGLSSDELKLTLALVGAILWLFGMLLILLPLGQSYPEPPPL